MGAPFSDVWLMTKAGRSMLSPWNLFSHGLLRSLSDLGTSFPARALP
jgi:hypothetical protein